MIYRESQPAILLRLALGASSLMIAGFAIVLAMPLPARIAMAAVAVLEGAMVFLLWTIEVEVTREAVRIRFGPGFIRSQIPLSSIRGAAVVHTRRLGVHRGLRRTTWVARPGPAVELELANGRRVVIGSERPARLAEAIEAARARTG